MLEEIFSGGGFLDAAGRRDVVGGDAVAENGERAGAADFRDLTGLQAEMREERRLLDVSALFVPLVDVAGGEGFHSTWDFARRNRDTVCGILRA